MARRILIVGGVAGGAGTAARLRRMDEEADIIVFERGRYISFANCGLPYYVGGTIKDRRDLLLQTPEAMMARFNIDIRVRNEVTRIDRERKEVEVRGPQGFYKEPYDELVLSPGSTPLVPPIPGIDGEGIFTLWTVPDVDRIKEYVDEHKPRHAVVVGGGFIGIEMAENLYDLGMDVTLVEMLDQVMPPFDYDMAQILHEQITAKGVNLELGSAVESFERSGQSTRVHLAGGTTLEADLVMLSIGVKPNGELAREAGLAVNERGGMIVDEWLRTEDEHIYALGDAIEVRHFIDGAPTMIPLAGPANRQARIVANNLCGVRESYRGTQGTSVAKVFDLSAASTGYNERQLTGQGLRKGEDFQSVVTILRSHAGYYPGGLPMTLKVHFDRDGKLLGAQCIGYDGVDKRIDVIATAIRFSGTVDDLRDLELAYAPPYSSAKDPVNMIGFVADNVRTGVMGGVAWDDMAGLIESGAQILDVREHEERELGWIEGSLHIPLNQLRDRIEELDATREVILYCAVGIRGYIAGRILDQRGFSTRNLIGGYTHYRRAIRDYSRRDVVAAQNTKAYGGKMIPEDRTTPAALHVDACGLQCPGPIMEVNRRMQDLEEGEVLEIMATDPGFPVDAKAWCIKTDNAFLCDEKKEDGFLVRIRKGAGKPAAAGATTGAAARDAGTMVVFSGDLDKALASFIIANGAAAMGKQMTLFFTFWGLNILRKDQRVPVKKKFIERMFGFMMPRGSKKLSLSKMNMAGMGTAMMKQVMHDKNVNSLEDLMQSALDAGVKIVACTMSMDIMGIKKEELIDGIEYGGVAAYLGETDGANLNLFV